MCVQCYIYITLGHTMLHNQELRFIPKTLVATASFTQFKNIWQYLLKIGVSKSKPLQGSIFSRYLNKISKDAKI